MIILSTLHLSLFAAIPAWDWVKVVGGTSHSDSVELTASSNRIFMATRLYQGEIGSKIYADLPQIVLSSFTLGGDYVNSKQLLQKEYYSVANVSLLPSGGVNVSASFNTTGASLFFENYDGELINIIGAQPTLINANGYAENVVAGSDSDSEGNVVIVGGFAGVTVGGVTYTGSAANDDDAFVIKYAPTGRVSWIKRGGGTESDWPLATAVDKKQGSIYVGGTSYSTSAAFGFEVISKGNQTSMPFLAKYSATGEVQWLISPTVSSMSRIVSLDVNDDGEIGFAGIQFDDSGGDENLNYPVFIGKCDSDGNLIWSRPAGMAIRGTYPKACPLIKFDKEGKIYLGESFLGSAQISGNTFNSAGQSDILLLSFSSQGDFLWGKQAGFIGDDRVTGMTVDAQNNLYLAGTLAFKGIFDDIKIEGTYKWTFFLARLQNKAQEKPMIIEQPKSFVATIGTPVTINVTATNAIGASFQWYFNGSPLPGRNSSSLNIEHFNITDAGSYYVVVQNSQGMVQSDFALLSVTDAANLYLSVHPSLTIFGTPGKTYRIEYGTELATPTTWHQAANVTLTNSPHIWVDLNAAVTPARVYRVLLQE